MHERAELSPGGPSAKHRDDRTQLLLCTVREPWRELNCHGRQRLVDGAQLFRLATDYVRAGLVATAEVAGFAIVDTKGSSPEVEFNMAQFFVHRKFKGRGIAAGAAGQCFARFSGLWEVNVIPLNRGAFHFWSRIIPRSAKGQVELSHRPAPHLRNAVKDIFRFST